MKSQWIYENQSKVLGNETEFLSSLDRLRAAAGIQLTENVCGVALDGAHRNKKRISDLLIREPLCDKLKDFVFPFTDADFFQIGLVNDEQILDRYHLRAGEPEPRPDSETHERNGNQANIELKRNVADEVLVFNDLQQPDEGCHSDAVYDYRPSHVAKNTKSYQTVKSIAHSIYKWRRRQDSNLWYPFGVQRFSKPPLSATQPRLRIVLKKPGFNSSGDANFVKVSGIKQPNDSCRIGLTHLVFARKIQGLLGTPPFLFQHIVSGVG